MNIIIQQYFFYGTAGLIPECFCCLLRHRDKKKKMYERLRGLIVATDITSHFSYSKGLEGLASRVHLREVSEYCNVPAWLTGSTVRIGYSDITSNDILLIMTVVVSLWLILILLLT